MPEHPDRPAPHLDADAMAAVPVWRFLLDGESTDPEADESCVRACERPPAVGEHTSYLVRATYELDDGRVLPGLVQVDVLGHEIACTASTLFAGGKAVDPMGHDTPRRLARLLNAGEARPLRWRLDVTLGGQAVPLAEDLPRSRALEALGLAWRLVRLKGLRSP